MKSLQSLIGAALRRSALAGPPRSPWLAWFEPLPVLNEEGETPMLGVMAALWMLSPELQKEFALESRKERARFIGWCCTLAGKEFQLMREAAVFGPARDLYFRPSRYSVEFSGGPVAVPYAVVAVFGLGVEQPSPDDPDTKKVARALLKWTFDKAGELFGGADALPGWFIEAARKAGPDFVTEFGRPENVSQAPRLPAPRGGFDRGGVNAYGPVTGASGDDDLRCGAAALAAVGIATASDLDAPVFGVNIFFMTPLETLRLFCTRGASLFLNRRSIGAWRWDLPEWPRELAFCAFLVDEIWAPSAFVRRAFEMSSPVPVVEAPPAVLAPPLAADRAKFGLPAKGFIFLVSADEGDSFNRSNPLAAIRAFKAAFPAPEVGVGLVVRTPSETIGADDRDELVQAASDDARIGLVDEALTQDERLALMASCDCLVSLHRATAFGRTIAEALILGLPVVATHWSGNVDYAEVGEQYLVEAKKVALGQDHEPFADGQLWAEPDIGAAAEALRAARTDQSRGEPAIPARFSAEAAGARYARRLELYGVTGAR